MRLVLMILNVLLLVQLPIIIYAVLTGAASLLAFAATIIVVVIILDVIFTKKYLDE